MDQENFDPFKVYLASWKLLEACEPTCFHFRSLFSTNECMYFVIITKKSVRTKLKWVWSGLMLVSSAKFLALPIYSRNPPSHPKTTIILRSDQTTALLKLKLSISFYWNVWKKVDQSMVNFYWSTKVDRSKWNLGTGLHFHISLFFNSSNRELSLSSYTDL